MRTIDLRSDTVTRPTPAMRRAMAEAEVGDDVFGEDPTVRRLEALVAERLGHEAALLVPSGTQANLVALLAHCGRGDEYIAGQRAHTYRWEGGGGAVLGGIQPQPIENRPDGTLDLRRVAAEIKPADDHFARTRLLCLENTIGGLVLPDGYLAEARELVDGRGLALHLDGARLWNAAVASGVEPATIAGPAHTVSVCLSKGLGAPAGSLLCGPAELVARAHRWRKVLGGGMRQSGVLAAAGIVAVEQHVDRLAEDHALAAALAEGLAGIAGVEVTGVATNMVFASFAGLGGPGLADALAAEGIRILGDSGPAPVRLVSHLDVRADDVPVVVAAVARYAERAGVR